MSVEDIFQSIMQLKRGEIVGYRVDAQYAFNRSTALSGILGATGNCQFGSLFEVCIIHHD